MWEYSQNTIKKRIEKTIPGNVRGQFKPQLRLHTALPYGENGYFKYAPAFEAEKCGRVPKSATPKYDSLACGLF